MTSLDAIGEEGTNFAEGGQLDSELLRDILSRQSKPLEGPGFLENLFGLGESPNLRRLNAQREQNAFTNALRLEELKVVKEQNKVANEFKGQELELDKETINVARERIQAEKENIRTKIDATVTLEAQQQSGRIMLSGMKHAQALAVLKATAKIEAGVADRKDLNLMGQVLASKGLSHQTFKLLGAKFTPMLESLGINFDVQVEKLREIDETDRKTSASMVKIGLEKAQTELEILQEQKSQANIKTQAAQQELNQGPQAQALTPEQGERAGAQGGIATILNSQAQAAMAAKDEGFGTTGGTEVVQAFQKYFLAVSSKDPNADLEGMLTAAKESLATFTQSAVDQDMSKLEVSDQLKKLFNAAAGVMTEAGTNAAGLAGGKATATGASQSNILNVTADQSAALRNADALIGMELPKTFEDRASASKISDQADRIIALGRPMAANKFIDDSGQLRIGADRSLTGMTKTRTSGENFARGAFTELEAKIARANNQDNPEQKDHDIRDALRFGMEQPSTQSYLQSIGTRDDELGELLQSIQAQSAGNNSGR